MTRADYAMICMQIWAVGAIVLIGLGSGRAAAPMILIALAFGAIAMWRRK